MIPSDKALLQQLSKLDAILTEAARSELHVVIAGEFNNGKSTLLNALVGRRLLFSSAVPTTGQITRVQFGQDEHIVVQKACGRRTKHSLEHLERLTVLDDAGAAEDEVDLVTVFCDAQVLRPSIVFADTPGTNDDAAQTRRALTALRTADVIMWVLRADAALKKSERALADQWLAENPTALLVPVVNFMNLVPLREAVAVRKRLDALLEQRCGPRVNWVRRMLGRPFFQIDAQRALAWSVDGDGEVEPDFAVLLDGFKRLSGRAGIDVIARSRVGWVGNCIELVRAANEEQLTRLKAEAEAAAQSREARLRQRNSQLRHFEARSKAALVVIQNDARNHLAERRESLLDTWLSNESVSSLREKTNRWGRTRLAEAADKFLETVTVSRTALAAEFGVPTKRKKIRMDALPIDFSVSLPITEFADDFWDLFGATPTAEFMSKTRSIVRVEWEKRARLLMEAVTSVWDRWTKRMSRVLKEQLSINWAPGTEGWHWELTDHLVEIKARELSLRWREGTKVENESGPFDVARRLAAFLKGLFVKPKEFLEPQAAKQAERLLKDRIAAGEPLRAEVLEREAVGVALAELADRLAKMTKNRL